MSIVGNFTQSYDHQSHVDGVGNGYRSQHLDEDEAHDTFPSEEERGQQTQHLARQLSRMSTGNHNGNSHEHDHGLFSEKSDPTLDPYSTEFDARKWTKAISQAGSHHRVSGFSFRNMSVHGFGTAADYQKTVGNIPLYAASLVRGMITGNKTKVQILNKIDGVLESGEMLVVLGPPGSGCTTMLKSIAGEMNGIYLDDETELNYRGITAKQMMGQFRGESIYTAEVDVHFPQLTVGDTLALSAEARAPRVPPGGLTKKQYATHMRDVIMAVFGISHTVNTIVGNDYVRGVSGGERKRVTIAEAALSGAPLQCWDNSTRGLDSANAVEFCKNLRLGADYLGVASVVAIYQSPGSAYDLFDKVSVLYEGEQIFFGKTTEAKEFFVRMGFDCPEQQTTPDFLTSLTSANERKARQGFEHMVPTTPQEFVSIWKASPEYKLLLGEIDAFNQRHPVHGERYEQFLSSRRAQQSTRLRPKSPYTLSYMGQIGLCLRRGFLRLRADPSLTLSQLFGNSVMALIISSIFYNLQPTTNSFYSRGGLLFFAILLNAFGSALEILTLYAQRGIVEKHARYAFYHPSAEAFASMITDIPYKIFNSICFNLIVYFMTNLRREPGAFFFFMFVSFILTLTMSMFFRAIASLSRTLTQALAPAAVLILAIIIYTGFAIPVTYMHGWSRWINYINPVAYGFEALMINEFHNRQYECSTFIPSGPGYTTSTGTEMVCSAVGSTAGSSTVNGDAYINSAYEYYHSHKWRNVGIIIAFMLFLMMVYLVAAELVSAKKSKGEILVFPRGHIPKSLRTKGSVSNDPEEKPVRPDPKVDLASEHGNKGGLDVAERGIIQRQTAIFSWRNVTYDIKIKKETRRILDHVDGWVKPGTLTALMGVSGAGKTTLLDVLATRVTMGVVTGEMLVNGKQRDISFQRKTGYVQQQDLHLATSSVREALRFSAILRQPRHVPKQEKLDYVEEVLRLMEMETYADAIVGVPGEGLNVEQRKRLTIAVELVAKPALLLFLDEPTSGLDSQTSWNILQLLRKLTAHGQAILCTIHQPSAILFESFDRLLFLAKGGKTVYYGEVGKKSHILIDYFVRNGAPKPKIDDNPAEWMLAAIGAAPGSHTDVDWHQAWLKSNEKQQVLKELDRLKSITDTNTNTERNTGEEQDKSAYAEFAAPLGTQMKTVIIRVFEQTWRTPSYIWAKLILVVSCSLFIGFTFYEADTSLQGLQNQLFAVFMLYSIFSQLVQQFMPSFVTQRSLYEVRERPSKTYSWKVFIVSQFVVEIPWAILGGVLMFFCWYYPIGMYNNAIPTNAVHLRGFQVFLFVEMFMLFSSTFAIAVVAGMNDAETAGNIANLLFSLTLVFCGVLVPYGSLPGFWKFMNRVSPFTYFSSGLLGAGLSNAALVCANNELLSFNPPGGQTCGQYMSTWISAYGGYLVDESATTACSFCSTNETNTFLANFDIEYSQVWRSFGILWAYVVANFFGAIGLYWLARVPKKSSSKEVVEEKDNQADQ